MLPNAAAGFLHPLCLAKVDPKTGRFASNTVSLGARGDSYYEYLLKQWLLSGKTDDALLRCVTSCCLPTSLSTSPHDVNVLTPAAARPTCNELSARKRHACPCRLPSVEASYRISTDCLHNAAAWSPPCKHHVIQQPCRHCWETTLNHTAHSLRHLHQRLSEPSVAVALCRRQYKAPTVPTSIDRPQTRPSPQLWL